MDPIDWKERRTLLKGGLGAFLAANAFASTTRLFALPQEPKIPGPPPKRVGWAIVGLGKLALEEILPAFAKSEHARLAALVSGHPDKAKAVADHYGVDAKHIYDYAGFDRIANDSDIDIVYIALPNSMHAEFTIRAHKAGKHVLCEKPMATSVAECQQMIEAGKQAGKKLMVAYRLHHEPFNLKAMQLAKEKPFGPISVFESVNIQDVKAPNIRLQKALGGGPLGDVGVYCINGSRYILNERPTEVSAMHRQPKDDPRFAEVPASTSFQMRFPSGVLASCVCGFDGAESRRYRVHCSKGWFELDPAFSYRGLHLETFDGSQHADPTIEPVDHFAKEMDHFSECVLSNKQPKTPGEEGLIDMQIIEALERSASFGRAEKV